MYYNLTIITDEDTILTVFTIAVNTLTLSTKIL